MINLFIFFIVFSLSFHPGTIFAQSQNVKETQISSEQKKYDEVKGHYCHYLSDDETLTQAHQIAYQLALRDAIESYGVYIYSVSQLSNFQLTEDLVNSFSAGLIKNIKKESVPPQGQIPGTDRKICYTVTGQIDPEQSKSSMEEFLAARKLSSPLAMELLKEATVGFWRSNNGTLIQLKFKGDEVKAFIYSTSPVGAQLGYKKGEAVFIGKIEGTTARGNFLSKYDSKKMNCYPDGRNVPAIAWIKGDAQGFNLELEIQDKRLDEDCYDIGPLTVRQIMRRETGKYFNRVKGFSIETPIDWEKREEYNGITFMSISPQENLEDKLRESVAITAQQLDPHFSLEDFFIRNLKNLNKLVDYKQLNTGMGTLGESETRWVSFLHTREGFRLKCVMYVLKNNEAGYIILFTSEENKFNKYSKKFEEISETFRFIQ